MGTTFIRPPGIPAPIVSNPPMPTVPRGLSYFLRRPFIVRPPIQLTFTDQIRFIARPRVLSGYLATGLSRR